MLRPACKGTVLRKLGIALLFVLVIALVCVWRFTALTPVSPHATPVAGNRPDQRVLDKTLLDAVRDGDTWSFVAFQNTRIRPIGANAASALLWLLPDRFWRWLFRATRTVPRRTITFGSRGD